MASSLEIKAGNERLIKIINAKKEKRLNTGPVTVGKFFHFDINCRIMCFSPGLQDWRRADRVLAANPEHTGEAVQNDPYFLSLEISNLSRYQLYQRFCC